MTPRDRQRITRKPKEGFAADLTKEQYIDAVLRHRLGVG
jgi:hypothetical protein